MSLNYFSDTVNEAMEEVTSWLINKENRCELQLKTRRLITVYLHLQKQPQFNILL